MSSVSRGNPLAAIGYLEILHNSRLGFTGGYLLVSPAGRPLEFHCSTPVLPTRAQEILFGSTLRGHVCGELIAGALVAAAKIKPHVVLVRRDDAAPNDDGLLVMRVEGVAAPALGEDSTSPGPDTPNRFPDTPNHLMIGESTFVVREARDHDVSGARELLESLAAHVDPSEPFERVCEAIREAQRIGAEEAAVDDAA